MPRVAADWIRTVRFLRGWATSRWDVEETETVVQPRGTPTPATLYLPRRRPQGLPGWVVLHGITRPGRAHPSLVRFARSLAGTPAAVLVPEIPEWRELRLAPESALPTVGASILALDARPETVPGRTGVVGFSFGCPMAIAASTDPALEGHLAIVVGFGGYCDLERTMRFQFTGRHSWNGVREQIQPDPYGRWIVGANYLTRIPGYERTTPVAEALWELARESGERRIVASDPIYDPLKASLRAGLPVDQRALFDLFAPPSGAEPDEAAGDRMGTLLAEAARRTAPGLDPAPILAGVRCAVRLIHGREDRLIPYTETLRLRHCFPPDADVSAFVTGLFAHSGSGSARSPVRFIMEAARFVHGLRGAIGGL